MICASARRSSHTPTVATNLGFVFIDDASIAFVRTNRSLGYQYGLYWPRQVYGRLVEELAAQGARAVALDVIFGELRPRSAGANGGRQHSGIG